MQDISKKAHFFLAMTVGALLLTSGGDTLAANGSVTYSYDALGRLVSASFDTGVIIMYGYDPNGNRTQQVINVNTSTLTWSASASPCSANCWGGALW
ncbi:RHS repeat protein [Methylosinus sporium]